MKYITCFSGRVVISALILKRTKNIKFFIKINDYKVRDVYGLMIDMIKKTKLKLPVEIKIHLLQLKKDELKLTNKIKK